MHRPALVIVAGLLVSGIARPVAADWHHPLYLSGGDYWRARVRVTIDNAADRPLEGRPVAVTVGTAEGEADLIGAAAESVRVCDAYGQEMLLAIEGPDGAAITRGPIPKGARVAIPAECPARGSVNYFVYFDNPRAWPVPDFLKVHLGVVNGDLEAGRGDAPDGWRHDPGDPRHRASWSTERPQSGRRCLKTVVDAGAEPTWIATRQSEIQISGGARYRMRAWVRAENVEGFAGWYIHVGNADNPMLAAPMLDGGGGTYPWKQVTAEFTAADDADRADLGTVLRGTGTAWFDSVTLECLEPGEVRARAAGCERMELRELGGAAPWPEPGKTPRCDYRAAVKVFNFTDTASASRVAVVDLKMLDARLRGRLDRAALRVEYQGEPVPCQVRGNMLLFAAEPSPRTVQTYYLYLPELADGEPIDVPTPAPASTVHNLVKNSGFEDGEPLPAGWTHNIPADASGLEVGTDDPHRADLGRRCARLHVATSAPSGWWGWHQTVPVEPGKTYLLAGAVKCKDVRGGQVAIHAHVHTAEGTLSSGQPMRSVGPAIGGTTDWTWMSGLLTMPRDAATLSLHLTTNTTGTVWHDDVLVAEVVPGVEPQFEGRPVTAEGGVAVWPVDAIVKVFGEDRLPKTQGAAQISLARNEQEPLQLAVCSPEAMRGVRVEVDPPTDSTGRRLGSPEINVVGYVPIDHPTSYYQSQSPAWHRKYPQTGGGCDGWPGMWPDPLLPRATLDLEPDTTQAVWITFTTGKETPAGEYAGAVRLVHGDKEIGKVPYRVRVWDFTLPDESHLAAIYDVRLGPAGAELWGKSLGEAYPELIRFMAARRLCPDTIRPAPVFRYRDGEVTADFTEYDKAAAVYFDELKLPFAYTPWNLYLFGWGHPPKTMFGQRPYEGDPPYEGVDRSKLRPEYKRAYQACLRTFWNHVKEKGWHKRIVLYISDEPFDRHEYIREQMKALCDMIHEVDAEIPIYSSTWKHVPDWDGYLDVWGIGHDGRVPPETMARLRAAGDRLWFTTDGQMCTDTPYRAVERLLPHYCFHYGVEAYEFWGVGWLTYDPYRFGWHRYIHQSSEPGQSYWVRYPNGDGFLIYPGAPIGHAGPVSSIRLEQAREGVEDFEYLTILRSRIERAESAGRDATAAREAMKRAAELVPIPNAGGRYSTKILPRPAAVAELKGVLGRSIEQLGP